MLVLLKFFQKQIIDHCCIFAIMAASSMYMYYYVIGLCLDLKSKPLIEHVSDDVIIKSRKFFFKNAS